ncbi:actin-5c-related [Anaeramoeba flamelloides]|uniref:Actin-5c-related n=1 Tax=Anaeramoeba flamelloides TaxID=1746091 RepID=A0AAV7ZDY6_9EUKA|nr:actin-5c-related [Anaeramoeba flamelloides]
MNKKPTIIDFGSSTIKIKKFGIDKPILKPSFVGLKRHHELIPVDETARIFPESKVLIEGSLIVQQNVISRGTIQDYDSFVRLFSNQISNEENENGKQRSIEQSPMFLLNSLSFDQNEKQKEKLCEILFEGFQTPSLIYSLSSPYNLYRGSQNTTSLTGISIEVGHTLTEIVPILEGELIIGTTKNNNKSIDNNIYYFGGNNINERLAKSIIKLKDSYFDFSSQTSNIIRTIEQFKEKSCYVNLNENKLGNLKKEINFVLPNGQQTRILPNNNLLWQCCEPYFNPTLLPNMNHLNQKGQEQCLPEKIISLIKPFNFEQRQSLLKNIILSGGCSLIKNFDKRLEYELNNLLLKNAKEEEKQNQMQEKVSEAIQCKINNKKMENRQYLSLVGASAFIESKDSDFLKKFIQKEEWEEFGQIILKQKQNISLLNNLNNYNTNNKYNNNNINNNNNNNNKNSNNINNNNNKNNNNFYNNKKKNNNRELKKIDVISSIKQYEQINKNQRVNEKKKEEEKKYFRNFFLKNEMINDNYYKKYHLTPTENDEDSFVRQNIDPIILDLGSSIAKVGFGGDNAPKAIFPTIIGWPKYTFVLNGISKKDIYYGDEAHQYKAYLSISSPIERGIPVNWDEYFYLHHHTYYCEMKVSPEVHTSIIALPALFPERALQEISQIMFEEFKVPRLHFGLDNYFNLLSITKSTGLMVSIGAGVTSIAPFYNYNIIESGIRKVNLGGRDVTNYLSKLLSLTQYQPTTTAHFEIMREIKEKSCFASLNYLQDLQLSKYSTKFEFKYNCSDNLKILLNSERFQACELFFNPSLDNLQIKPIQKLIVESIMSCPIDFQEDLFNNIYIFGGSTMFKNFTERLEMEIHQIVPKKIKIKICAPHERNFSTWIGASIFSEYYQNKQTDKKFTREIYDNEGSSGIRNYMNNSSPYINILNTFDCAIGKNCHYSNFQKKQHLLEKHSNLINNLKIKDQKQYEKNLNLQKKYKSITKKSIELNTLVKDLKVKNNLYVQKLKELKEELQLNL